MCCTQLHLAGAALQSYLCLQGIAGKVVAQNKDVELVHDSVFCDNMCLHRKPAICRAGGNRVDERGHPTLRTICRQAGGCGILQN